MQKNAWNISSEDRKFLSLLKEIRKEFLDAGYTQKHINENIKKIRRNSKDSN